MSARCKHCGFLNSSADVFCQRCGTARTANGETKAGQPSSIRRRVDLRNTLLFVLCGAIVTGSGAAWVVLRDSERLLTHERKMDVLQESLEDAISSKDWVRAQSSVDEVAAMASKDPRLAQWRERLNGARQTAELADQAVKDFASRLAGLRLSVSNAIAANQWDAAERYLSEFRQVAPRDQQLTRWSLDIERGRVIDAKITALRSSISYHISIEQWTVADSENEELLNIAPADRDASRWRIQITDGIQRQRRKQELAIQSERKSRLRDSITNAIQAQSWQVAESRLREYQQLAPDNSQTIVWRSLIEQGRRREHQAAATPSNQEQQANVRPNRRTVFQAYHSHFLQGCNGQLTINDDSIDYVASDGRHRFSFAIQRGKELEVRFGPYGLTVKDKMAKETFMVGGVSVDEIRSILNERFRALR